ncbi:MAG: OmpH family outer membrane protein [Candidatus Omnitrophota bacterium]
MKKTTAVMVVLFSFVLVSLVYAADKLAYVDLSRTFGEYTKTKEYEKVLEEKQKVYEAERNKKINELKQLEDKLNLLNDKEKEAKRSDLEVKIKDFQDFDSQKQNELRKEGMEKEKEILKAIEETVKQYSEKEGYTLVFNDRVLIYQSKNLDITNEIIKILNKEKK